MIGAGAEGAEEAVPFLGQALTPDGNGALPPRLALVIGVATYDPADHVSIPSLPGVARDTQRVVEALSDADFRVTEPRNNGGRVTRNDILEALNRFSLNVRQLRSTSGKKPVVLVYFGGHGVTNGTDNLLIPADFNPTFQEDLKDMALPLATIRERLEALDVSLRYIILDACRNQLPLSLASVSGAGAPAYKPGMTRMPIDTAGETIWFATLNGNVASDGSTFTQRLLDVLDKERTKAEKEAADPRFSEEAASPQPVAGAYGNTSSVLDQVAISMAGSAQVPDRAGNPPPLILYPTRANYRTELRLFDQFKAAPSFQRRYCLSKTYLDAFFLYSYFSTNIAGWKTKFEELVEGGELPSCADLATNQVASADLPVKTATGEWRVVASARSPFTEPGQLASAAAEESGGRTPAGGDTPPPSRTPVIAGFPDDLSQLSLATAGTNLPVYRFANAGGAAVTTLDKGQLLAIGDTNGAFVRVQTPDGTEGYAEQKLVNAGTNLLRVTLGYDDRGELTDASQTALKALADTIVYDAAIEYRDSDSKGGLLLAISAFDELRKATFVPMELTPLYRAADASNPLPPRSVRILLTALPLDPALRNSAYSYSGGTVSLDAAVTLSQPVLASASTGAILGQGSAFACASPLAAEATADRTVLVSYPSASEAGAAETVRRVFGTVGFAVPDPIQRGTRIQKQGTRVTYCAADQGLIDRAKAPLSACFGDAFRYFPTSDRALCASGRIDVVVTDASLAIN
ncbi:caspase family protein [Pleomorphomonas diazotrophica]|nr:caspase family protein [Pleomorphomonas diazotrophica]